MIDFSKLSNIFPPLLLGYIFNFDGQQYEAFQKSHEVELNIQQEEVFAYLEDLINKQRELRYNAGENVLIDAGLLCRFLFEGEKSLAFQLRQYCGGTPYQHTCSGDLLIDCLASHVNMYFPSLLAEEHMPSLNQQLIDGLIAVVTNDSIAKLIKTTETQKILSAPLFDADKNPIGYLYENICNFAYVLFRNCYLNCVYKLCVSEESILKELSSAVAFLRRVANEKSATIQSCLGIFGVGFGGFDTLELEDLTLRNIAGHDLSQKISSTTVEVWANHPDVPFYGLTAESSYVINAASKKDKPPCRNYSYIDDYKVLSDLEKKAENFYLALLFVKKKYSVFRTSFQSTGYYFRHSEYGAGAFEHSTKLIPLYQSECPEVKKWYGLIRNNTEHSINNALENIKNAIMRENSIADSIMSGFYAWESMFTSREDTTASVVKAVSIYSGSDENRVDDLYDRFRCRKAHGDAFKIHSDETLDSIRSEVIEIAVTCVKKLFEDDKLKNLKASNRVKKLCGQ